MLCSLVCIVILVSFVVDYLVLVLVIAVGRIRTYNSMIYRVVSSDFSLTILPHFLMFIYVYRNIPLFFDILFFRLLARILKTHIKDITSMSVPIMPNITYPKFPEKQKIVLIYIKYTYLSSL